MHFSFGPSIPLLDCLESRLPVNTELRIFFQLAAGSGMLITFTQTCWSHLLEFIHIQLNRWMCTLLLNIWPRLQSLIDYYSIMSNTLVL